jgi:uncharacterized protein (TIGR02270 family)
MKRAGLVSALGWLEYGSVAEWISRLLDARTPVHRAVGVAACAIHRRDPGRALAAALEDADPILRGRALRAVGELKRHDLVNVLRARVMDSDDECRYWAAWSLALMQEPEGLKPLHEWCQIESPAGRRALQLYLRIADTDRSREVVREMAQDPSRLRLAVIGTGVIGDPVSVPWLVRRMQDPETARVAGEAFTTITGVDLALHDLDTPPPAAAENDAAALEEVLDLTYDSNLPWPSPTRVADWWERNAESFHVGTRYLAGRPITEASVADLLFKGKQRQRAAAALELALLRPHEVLFEVRARANRQRQELSAWTS